MPAENGHPPLKPSFEDEFPDPEHSWSEGAERMHDLGIINTTQAELSNVPRKGLAIKMDVPTVEKPDVKQTVNRGNFALTKSGEIDRRFLTHKEKGSEYRLPEDQRNLQ